MGCNWTADKRADTHVPAGTGAGARTPAPLQLSAAAVRLILCGRNPCAPLSGCAGGSTSDVGAPSGGRSLDCPDRDERRLHRPRLGELHRDFRRRAALPAGSVLFFTSSSGGPAI